MQTNMNTHIKGWHFTPDTLQDGRALPAIGETLTHEGEVSICSSGLHASKYILDAIGYCPSGSTKLHKVELWGDVEQHDDKLVARNRVILQTVPAEAFLRDFAREVALEAFLSYFPAKGIGSEEDRQVVLTYLATGDADLRSEAYDAGWRLRDAASKHWSKIWDATYEAELAKRGYTRQSGWNARYGSAARADAADAAAARADAADAAAAADAWDRAYKEACEFQATLAERLLMQPGIPLHELNHPNNPTP